MLSRIKSRLRIQRQMAKLYDGLLSGLSGMQIAARLSECYPNFWLYTVLVEERERLIAKLHRNGVLAATPHQRNDRLLQKWIHGHPRRRLPGVDVFSRNYLRLPIGPWMTLPTIEKVCALIKSRRRRFFAVRYCVIISCTKGEVRFCESRIRA
jgi:dTDP-4-amino-4,6-dideoxygalactose transaminase